MSSAAPLARRGSSAGKPSSNGTTNGAPPLPKVSRSNDQVDLLALESNVKQVLSLHTPPSP